MKETKDNNLYSDFLKSIKERDDRVKAYVVSAMRFLYDRGYITQEEYLNGESKRIYDIKAYDRSQGGMNIMFVFDEREWFIGVDVDSMLNIIKAEFHIIDGDSQVLYKRK